ncbi:MAG: HAD hydrolase family protein [Subdoligranulum sp.]
MENRDIRIAFCDIDGTLLPPDHHLPESTVAALEHHRAPKGVAALPSKTGRRAGHPAYT